MLRRLVGLATAVVGLVALWLKTFGPPELEPSHGPGETPPPGIIEPLKPPPDPVTSSDTRPPVGPQGNEPKPVPPAPSPAPSPAPGAMSEVSAAPAETAEPCLGLRPELELTSARVRYVKDTYDRHSYTLELTVRSASGGSVSVSWPAQSTLVDDHGQQLTNPRMNVPQSSGHVGTAAEYLFRQGLKVRPGEPQTLSYEFLGATSRGGSVSLSGALVLARQVGGDYLATKKNLSCNDLPVPPPGGAPETSAPAGGSAAGERGRSCVGLGPELTMEQVAARFLTDRYGRKSYRLDLTVKNAGTLATSIAFYDTGKLLDDKDTVLSGSQLNFPQGHNYDYEKYAEDHFKRGLEIAPGQSQQLTYNFLSATQRSTRVSVTSNVVFAQRKADGNFEAGLRTLSCRGISVQ